ncbi:nucleoside hydrolase [Pseudoleptotrichia goodfellowii]|uniref:Putative pyrimidine-specific ribonucleoside hydrolase RihB n=1 Tax=Pseudoleptotrichia goodfellowii TaxID=157692 RepID=A0A510JAI9_9FUSO|nr:nucleoside hydrolase [Pseudoleptotrichia goodfellowii]BBM36302.1 putative pyrimidine-specific ribonucleoside hydrolase RihB [Pseudoleptotrichia goodfellowii]
MKKKIILDCDPGHDDAIAIMAAGLHEDFELLGITTVAGNQTIEKTTNNALRICDYFNFKTPVYRGMSEPLVRKNQIIATDFHGETGLDGIKLDKTDRQPEKEHGVNFIINTLLNSNEKITLVPVGPLTNIAMALKLEPKIKEKIEKIVLMGGSCKGGNVTPFAEFNIYADPEAASIVFSSGVPIFMMGLEVTNKTAPDEKIVKKIQRLKTKAADFLNQGLHFPKRYDENGNFIYHTLHDVVTLIYLIDQNTVKLEKINCEIETKDEEKYGQTICSNCDCKDNNNISSSNIQTAVEIDLDKFWEIIFEVIEKY